MQGFIDKDRWKTFLDEFTKRNQLRATRLEVGGEISARLHIRRESHLERGTMSGLEARLDPHKFRRIHRSLIINLSRIKELQTLFHGEYVVTLQNGTQLTSGRSYRDKLQPLLENEF